MTAPPDHIGPYHIVADLGTGGMGRVYLAEASQAVGELSEGDHVALKVVHPHLLGREGGFKRFLREADLGSRVRHRNVVRTYDVDALIQDGEHHHFIVMEYVQGQTLRSLLRELGRLPEELVRRIAIEITRGLDGVHAIGVVHRDLKPENVLITEDEKVKIMDLGVSRLVEESIRLSSSGQFVGSMQYGAPEQFTNPEAIDARTDLYALGCVIYELMTGQRPFRNADPMSLMTQIVSDSPEPPSAQNPEITEFLEEVVLTLLRKRRAERFGSAHELLHVLEAGEHSPWWKDRAARPRSAVTQRNAVVPVERTDPIVGREGELSMLREALGRARAGVGQVVVLEGDAGIGKSRLVAEFAHRLDGKNISTPVLYGRHPPGDGVPAIAAFAQALGHHVAPGAFDPILLGTQADSALQAVAEALAGPKPAPEALGRALAGAVCELAEKRPLVLIIEDLHEAPPEGRELFADVASAIHRVPVLLIGTTRPDVPKAWITSLERMEHGGRIGVGRLDAGGVEMLVRRLLPGVCKVRDFARAVVIKSDGNPLFVLEILRDVEQQGVDVEQQSPGSAIRVPESLQELVEARLAPLDDDERQLLEVAACCGVRFDPTLVAEAAGEEPIAALRRLARIESRRRLIRSAGHAFEFEHHQVREVVYSSLPAALARQYHAVIGERLEARIEAAEKPPSGAEAVQLCRQLFRAERADRAIAYLDRAQAHLAACGQNDAEIELVNAALDASVPLNACRRVKLLLSKAANLGFLGRTAEQGLCLREAERIAADAGCDQALGRALGALGGFEVRAGHFDAALDVLVRSEELAVASRDRPTEAAVCGRLGRVLKNLGRYQEAIAYHKRQLRIVRDLDDRRGEVVASANLGALYATIGRFELGREKLERAVHVAREIGWRWGEAMDSGRLGQVLESLGRFGEALPCFEHQVAISREEGSPDGEARGLVNLGRVSVLLGKFALARARLEDAVVIAEDLGRAQLVADARRALGVLEAWLQNTDTAVVHLEAAAKARRRAGGAYGSVGDRLALARIHWDVGRRDEASRLFAEVREDAKAISALDAQIVARAFLEYSDGALPSAELREIIREGRNLTALTRLDLCAVLWRWTREPEWAGLAGRLLATIVESAPADAREAMVTCVPPFVRADSIRNTIASSA